MMSPFRRWIWVMVALAFPALSWAGNRAWLMVNTTAEDTLLVTDSAEQKRLSDGGWKTDAELDLFSEGDAQRSALHRLVKTDEARAARLLSGRADEVERAKKHGFSEEGVLGYVALTQTAPELVPVKRFEKGGRFIWLAGPNHRAWAEKAGWKLVGDDFWVGLSAK